MSDLFTPVDEILKLHERHPELVVSGSKYSAYAMISQTKKLIISPERRPIEWVVVDLRCGATTEVFDSDLADSEFSIIKMYASSLRDIRSNAVSEAV
jgi:hypothetical protein